MPSSRAGLEWRLSFVEDFGGLDLVPHTPRAVMRVLGWMVVCRPPVQSAQEIKDGLALSAGSVSTAVNALCDDGLLDRVVHPGGRRVHYRLSAQGWESVVEARLRALTETRQAADRALQASGGEADDRLRALRDNSARFEAGIVELLRGGRMERGEAAPGTEVAAATPVGHHA